ncbi:long-chain fatty acid--CoA ligase [Candidatus Thorarchaeota archaeon]|nr:MAG: long-chain fatty acid--CoA ligase [Candidatus Thorarchaeota archaeon]
MKEYLWHKHRWPEDARKELEYPDEPLFAMLDRAAEESGDRPYTVWAGVSHTFSEVKASADKIANFLASKGIGPNDKVALFLPNLPHFPPVFFGSLKTGATVVTCNPMYKARELNYQLNDTGATVVFVMDHPKFTPTCFEAIEGTDVDTVIVCGVKGFLPKLKGIIGGLLGKIPKSPYYKDSITYFYDDIIDEYEAKSPDVEVDPDDLALILYTGGTTGTPKGAALRHRNLLANVLQINEWVNLSPEDIDAPKKIIYGEEVFVGALPWYHSYGLTLTLLMSTYLAGQLVCIPDPRAGDPPLSDLLRDLEKYRGTILNCVPALYAGIVNHPHVDDYDLTSIKICSSGAAPLPPELAKNFEDVTGAILFEGYGLSETSPVTHINPTNKRDRRFGSIGLPVPDTIAKIVDADTGTSELSVGETGEIAIHGPQVMMGYYGKPEETENVMREFEGKRFFLTGDIGHMDSEGYFVISDRKKDMINVGGLKAYPREIEDVFYEHPKIAMAAAIGVPREDDPSNEYVKAFIVPKDNVDVSSEEFIEWARERMAGYKRPREVDIVDSLPLSQVGKVLRRELRKQELEKRGMVD